MAGAAQARGVMERRGTRLIPHTRRTTACGGFLPRPCHPPLSFASELLCPAQ